MEGARNNWAEAHIIHNVACTTGRIDIRDGTPNVIERRGTMTPSIHYPIACRRNRSGVAELAFR